MRPLLSVLMWILLSPVLPVHAAEPAILWLGVVRTDHAIIPFAMHDGSSWSNPWPKGEHVNSRAIPDTTLTLDTIPKTWHSPLPRIPREWIFQKMNGPSETVTVTRPATVYSWCETYQGLLIGDAPRPINTDTVLAREGFATSAKIQTSPVLPIKKGSDEWNRLIAFIRPVFDKMEDDHGHPLPKADRAKAEFRVIRLDHGQPGLDGRTIIHFEVERDYEKTKQLPLLSPSSRSCMNGWIAVDSSGEYTFIEKLFGNESGAGGGIIRITPLGTVVIRGETLWIVVKRFYEGEEYSVLRMTSEGVITLIDTYAGGC